MASTVQRDPDTFHPLEIIPYFRRFPYTSTRNFVYTFIWSTLFGLTFYAMGSISDGHLHSWLAFAIYMLISNAIGYSIHALFHVGRLLGLPQAARRNGFFARCVYFAGVPMLGVFIGFALVSLFFDFGFKSWFVKPAAVLSVVVISFIISTVLSVIFFWRERSAVAEAAMAREREKRERIERESIAAHLRALQAQIEPHFLFNTLANVSSLIDADRGEAKRMLESFIRFLRSSLAATRAETTSLGAEAELIAAYLDVLQVRMGGRLRYAIDVAPELRGFALPPMLLQPMVENSIRHGLEPKVDGGEVSLRAAGEGAAVVIDIADTGVGFAPTTRGGVGLSNLRERLRLLYGERASLEISEASGGGTRVRLRLPA
ncbi:MAG TPA: histidine kinase [Usitatibacter sp.]|nr:histidine kinase [Usitatibacter sp.]